MKTAKDYARIIVAAFSLSCSGAPALANFAMSPSGATTLFAIDAANQGTALCAAASTECAGSVPINTAGAPLFVTANPGVVSQATAASLNATVVGTGTFAAQLTGATNNINNIAGTISLPTLAATSTKQSDGSQKSQIVDGSGNVIGSTSNNLNVQCANCSGSGVSAADAATFTAGTSLMAPAGGQFTTGGATACVTGHECTVGITAARAFLTDLSSQAGVAITSSPSAYGTAPTGNVIGANVFVTNSTAALADNVDGVTPTASLANSPVNNYSYLFDGTNFNRQRSGGVAGMAGVGGDTASGATNAGNPIQAGGRAQNAEATAVTNGQRVAAAFDLVGKLITLPYANPENFVSGAITSAMTGTTSTSLVAAPAAGLRNYITQCSFSNSHATVGTDIILQDGSGGTTLYLAPTAPAFGGAEITFPTPLRQPTTATALFAQNVTTGSNTKVSCSGYKGA